MRVIKFRAWFKNNSEMKIIAMNNIYKLKYSYWYLSPLPMSDYEPIEVMQYTGIEDKNEVDIYEGDIISYWWSRRNRGAVYFENGSYMVDGYLLKDCPDDTEVIGNIYENRELLNA